MRVDALKIVTVSSNCLGNDYCACATTVGVASSYNYANAVTKFSNEACILIVTLRSTGVACPLLRKGVYKPLLL